jgi:hypothetical protein
MKRLSGLTLLDEQEGTGRVAQKGDHVVYNMRPDAVLVAEIWLRGVLEASTVRVQ